MIAITVKLYVVSLLVYRHSLWTNSPCHWHRNLLFWSILSLLFCVFILLAINDKKGLILEVHVGFTPY